MSNADIARMVAQIEASRVALISDSCYSGSLATDQRIRATVGTVDPVQFPSRKSVVVMLSGGKEPVADAGMQGHSPLAWNLMSNLRQVDLAAGAAYSSACASRSPRSCLSECSTGPSPRRATRAAGTTCSNSGSLSRARNDRRVWP
jgi:hypothetical protein